MSDPSGPLQQAILAALEAAPALPHGAIVYDDVPQAAAFPYVSFGEGQVLPDKAACFEDDVEVFFSLDAWSRAQGFAQVKAIAAAIVDKLDEAELAVAGFRVIVLELQSVQYLRDPDGKTRRALISFRSLIQPST